MAAVTLAPEDLAPFADIPEAKAAAMIEDAMALAARVAPCITEDSFEHESAARAILRGAVLRWHESGSGALTQRQQTAGSFSVGESYDTRQTRRGMFWPSEITELQKLCSSGSSGAFAVDTVASSYPVHAWWCNLAFGGSACSCGSDLNRHEGPIFGLTGDDL